MRIIKINPQNPSPKAVKIATEVIRKGGVIIYPTDTIYGVGASALNQKAIDKVYKIKARPESKPLSVIISDMAMAKKYACMGKTQEEIFCALLPGAFTLILKAKAAKRKTESINHYHTLEYDRISKKQGNIFTIYKNTISIRIPDCKITELLSKELGIPFTATSANISGLPGSGDVNKVLKQLENKKNSACQELDLVDLVLDAGILPKKKPSVVIDLTGENPKIIRK